jgi:hypothetical protein
LEAGSLSQGGASVAIGYQAGSNSQASNAVAIGYLAGYSLQSDDSIAIGHDAGWSDQSDGGIAIGYQAGYQSQHSGAIAIGIGAGNDSQDVSSIAIGTGAGNNQQGAYSVAIGAGAGNYQQGAYSVAIGTGAGTVSQAANSIIFNASDISLNTDSSGFYVNPVHTRTNPDLSSGAPSRWIGYDPIRSEIFTTSLRPAGFNIASFSSDASQYQISGADTSNAPTTISFNTVEYATPGISCDMVSFPTRIRVFETGIYKFVWSIQLDKTEGGVKFCDIWLRKNGVNIPRTACQIVVDGNKGETLPMCEYILSLNAGEYVEVVFASEDFSMAVAAFPPISTPYVRPAIPSIIANIYQLGV